jgi:hypothetical protein
MVVEGEDDKFAIIQLMSHHTNWPGGKDNAPVRLEAAASVDAILAENFLSTKLKESGTKVLGVVLDADENFDGRWQRTRQICAKLFKDVPEKMPANGLIGLPRPHRRIPHRVKQRRGIRQPRRPRTNVLHMCAFILLPRRERRIERRRAQLVA